MRHKLSKEEVKAMANSLFFEMDEAQVQQLQNEFNMVIDNFDKLSQLDVSKLQPTNFPVKSSFNQLRKDEKLSENDSEEILASINNKKDRMVVVK